MNLIAERHWTAAAGLAPAAVSVRGLAKSFGNGRKVLDGIDLDIASGSLVALIGANGTGKSTLLRCLPRLVMPDTGSITVFEEDVVVAPAGKLRRLRSRIGFVFQKHNLVGRLCALTNVIHGAQGRGFGARAWCQGFASAALRAEAMHCLDRVGLAHIAGQRADSLSGGQSQRVAIARALMQRPELVLADEPAASLDPQAGDEIMQLLLSLMREQRITVLFASHNLRHSIEFADRIIGLSGGHVTLDTLAAAANETELRAIYD